jgi:hypothetical protein
VTFAGINYLAVVVAAAFALVASTAWYAFLNRIVAPFSAPREQTMKTSKPPGGFLANICAVVGYLIMAFTLAGLLGHLGPDQVTVGNGIISGAFVWFGFVLTTMTINYSFSGRDWRRLVVHAGSWLIVLVVIGATIGAFGV